MRIIKAVIFDFDNTIVHMPTQIRLFHKVKGDYIGLSTASFARHKNLIGKTGFLRNCNFDSRSFEEFRTQRDKSYFTEQIVEVLRSETTQWKAMYFDYFLEMLSKEEDAENVYILSARGHEPEEFLKGLRVLQSYLDNVHGKKIHLPRKEHLHFVGNMPNIAEAKAQVIESIIKKESGENTTVIEFADDDEENIHKAQGLIEGLKDNFAHISFEISHVLETSVKKLLIKGK